MSANWNTTINGTINGTEQSSCVNPTAEITGATILYGLLFVVSLVGNSFIGIIVYKSKPMRKPINFLIVNMAMSDLLYTIIVYPFILTSLYVDPWLISGPLGEAFCKLSPFLPVVSAVVSIQSLVLIALDRFGAVVFPLRSPLISSKKCPFFIIATWIVAMAICSPVLFGYKLVEYPGKLVCTYQWNEVFGDSSSHENYVIIIHVILFYTPLVLISVLYIIIVVKLKSQKTPGEQPVNVGQQRAKRERNVLQMAIAIVLGFVVCWLPYSISEILVLFAPKNVTSPCSHRGGYFAIVAFCMATAYCAINPCICFIFSGNYRRGLMNLLRCFSAVQSRNQVAP